MALAPVIYWLIKKLKFPFLIILGLCWYLNYSFDIPGLSTVSLFFFSLGAYFSINGLDVLEIFRKLSYAPLAYVALLIADAATQGMEFNTYVNHFSILLGVATVFIVASYLLEKGRVRVNAFLTEGCFFVYAIHGLFINMYMTLLIMVLKPVSLLPLIALYIFVPLTTILFCLATYYISKRYFPSLTRILSGGR